MKTKTKRMIAGALLGELFVIVGAWCAGFDFNERGPVAVCVYVGATALAAVGAGWAGDYSNDK